MTRRRFLEQGECDQVIGIRDSGLGSDQNRANVIVPQLLRERPDMPIASGNILQGFVGVVSPGQLLTGRPIKGEADDPRETIAKCEIVILGECQVILPNQ